MTGATFKEGSAIKITAEERNCRLINFAQHMINWEKGSSHPDDVARYEEDLDRELAVISAGRPELYEIASQIRSGQLQVEPLGRGEE